MTFSIPRAGGVVNDCGALAESDGNHPQRTIDCSPAPKEWSALELPYDGNELSMVILLPKLEQFRATEASLNSQQVNNMIRSIQSRQVILSMPRFKFFNPASA